jgi:hypothetical protein
MQEKLLRCGWWTLNRDKIVSSTANYWVFVLYSFHKTGGDEVRNSWGENEVQYIIIRPEELIKRYDKKDRIQSYIWVTREPQRRCIETRDLKKAERQDIVINDLPASEVRDFF